MNTNATDGDTMINIQATIRWKGYSPDELTKGSHKRVWANCEICGGGRWISFRDYRDSCISCAAIKKNTGRVLSTQTKEKISAAHIGMKASDKARMKMSNSRKGDSNHFFGKHHTKETREKQSLAKIGKPNLKLREKPLSEAHKQNLSKAKTGIPSPMKGIPMSDETKKKMSENHADFTKEKHPNWNGGRKLANARKHAKRKLFGFIPLNNQSMDTFVGHHVDKTHVIFIPVELHTSVWHSIIRSINMDIINDKVCDWFLEYQRVVI